MELTRRDFLKGGAATGLAAFLPSCREKKPNYEIKITNLEYAEIENEHSYVFIANIKNNTSLNITLTAADIYFQNSNIRLTGPINEKIKAKNKISSKCTFSVKYSPEIIHVKYTGKNEKESPIKVSQTFTFSAP